MTSLLLFKNSGSTFLLSNIQGEVGKATANWIGDQGIKFDAANSPLAEAGKIAAHGVTSGAIAEITGGKFAAGAAGGAMSEIASNWSLGAFGGNEEYQVALNKVLGGLAAAAVTGDAADFDTGADRAETVHRYNYLEHKERSERDSLLREAQKGNLTEAQQERLAALNFKDALSDETLLKACISGSASECQAARQDAITKADTYPNLGYQYPKESLAGYQQIEQLLAGTTEEAIQTQRVYDGLVASYQRMGMSAENAKTLVGYQLGAMYVVGGVAGAKSMAAVEKGIAQNKLPNAKESSGAENVSTYPKLKDDLKQQNLDNIAAYDHRLAIAIKGDGSGKIDFGMGAGTRSESDGLGMIWVGDGARQTSQGGWISADGTRGYRPPSEKDTPHATTGVQANFERYEIQDGKRVKVGNSHLNIMD